MQDKELKDYLKNYLRKGDLQETAKQLEELLNTSLTEILEENNKATAEIAKCRLADEIVDLGKQYIKEYVTFNNNNVETLVLEHLCTREKFFEFIDGLIAGIDFAKKLDSSFDFSVFN